MKNLGKKIFILLTFLTTTIHASVTAHVEPPVVYSGETATYVLTITGEKVHKPIVTDICGNNIVSAGSQTNIEMVNANYKKSYVFSYEFAPKKSCVIAPTNVEIDGKIEKSNEVKVVVKPASQDKNAAFLLSLKASKSDIFVGEPFILHLELKQSKRLAVVDNRFMKPDFKGFWVKGESRITREETPEYIIRHVDYKLAPQREGNLTIKPAQIRIALRANRRDMWNSFMPQVKWKNYSSNEVQIHAKPLPNNAKIVGNFTISAEANKQEIASSEAVNVTVTVEGEGNLEDIESFKPYINGVNVFDEKIEIHGNTLTQKFAFVSDKDFTIPPFKLAFYNLTTKRVEQIKTEPIYIKVKGSAKTTAPLNIKKDERSKPVVKKAQELGATANGTFSYIWLIIAFVVGIIVGVVLMVVKPFQKVKKEKCFNIKDEKLLLFKLLPYRDSDRDVKIIVDILEENLYRDKKEKIDKKLLKEVLKRCDIS